jgi:hypothetical protein
MEKNMVSMTKVLGLILSTKTNKPKTAMTTKKHVVIVY